MTNLSLIVAAVMLAMITAIAGYTLGDVPPYYVPEPGFETCQGGC